MNKHRKLPRSVARQAGFTLIELMIAMGIGLIIMLGMTFTFVNLKNTFQSQDRLSQLQDNERLALSMLTTSLNEAGFHPDPKNPAQIAASGPPTTTPGGAMAIGTYIFGTADGNTATTPESVSTQYAVASGTDITSCLGTTNAGASTVTVRNIFYVDPTKNSLMCKVMVNGATTDAMAHSGTAEELISGVKKMTVYYGIAPSGTQITTYKASGSVTAAEWAGSVKAVRVQLDFVNPFDSTATISRTHTINLMN
ncbi:MAG: PilW family protein [Betaproteobacteria bacterium]